MPRKRIGADGQLARADRGRVERLAAELKGGQAFGQPTIYEQEYSTGKMRVTVLWDEWEGIPLEERSATILRAYEQTEGPAFRDRIALASGLTIPEAHAAGMLPYQIIAAVRKNDPVTAEQAREAVLEEGASVLGSAQAPQLRYATEEEAEECRQRLIRRFPGSDDVWIINREITAQAHDWAQVE
jgi:hypothetical protein